MHLVEPEQSFLTEIPLASKRGGSTECALRIAIGLLRWQAPDLLSTRKRCTQPSALVQLLLRTTSRELVRTFYRLQLVGRPDARAASQPANWQTSVGSPTEATIGCLHRRLLQLMRS